MLLYYAPVLFAESIQVRIGRIAGQYAKPRSSGTEKIGDREVTSFRYVVRLIYACQRSSFRNFAEVTTLTGQFHNNVLPGPRV
jgi:3-deoxy-D-arabino-heptulosonate 7-phosphate (DAHP) synthase class II